MVVVAQCGSRPVGWVGQAPGKDCGDRMQSVGERHDDAEVPAASTHSPEQVFVLLGVRGPYPAVGIDDVHLEEVVAGQAVVTVEPPETSPESQPDDARH